MKVLVIFVPLLLMDTVGRRPLLIASNIGICLAQLLISMSFLFGPDNSAGARHALEYYHHAVPPFEHRSQTCRCTTGGNEPEPEPEPEPEIPPVAKWLAVAGQCAFVAAFSLGVGPLAHVLSSELYPLRLRGVAVGLATFINRVTSGTIALTFLSLQAALTPAGAFGLYATIAVRPLHAGAACYFVSMLPVPIVDSAAADNGAITAKCSRCRQRQHCLPFLSCLKPRADHSNN